jgi:phage recombination protein Bet
MSNSQLAQRHESTVATVAGFTRDDVELLKRTVAQDTTDDELALFLKVAQARNLNPFAGQIHAIVRNDKRAPRGKKMTIQTSIDGYRLIAQRSKAYEGQEGPWWAGADGQWREMWLPAQPPAAAKVGVRRKGFTATLYRVALWSEYKQTYPNGDLVSMWANRPAGQLAKCAEALALRAAFPEELQGIYTDDEMHQADSADATVVIDGTAYPGDDLNRKGADDDHRHLVERIAARADELVDDGAMSPDDRAKAIGYAGKSLAHAEKAWDRLTQREPEQPAVEGSS